MRAMKERFRVKNAEESKCATCEYFREARGIDGEVFARSCGCFEGVRIPEMVTECSSFSFKWSDPPFHLVNAAWVPVYSNDRTRIVTFFDRRSLTEGQANLLRECATVTLKEFGEAKNDPEVH